MNIKQTILISKIFVTIVMVWMAVIWWQKDEPTLKEMQIMSIAETHADKGFGFTKGYNVYPERGGKYSDIEHTKQGGVKYHLDTNYTAYVSVPVLVPVTAWSFYAMFDLGIHSSKAVFLVFTIICLFLFFLFSDTYVKEESRAIFNMFILSPFFLFNYYYNDINLNSLVLSFSMLSYLFFLDYLKFGKPSSLWLFAICLFINTWSSFFIISIYPVFFLHLFFDNRFTKSERIKKITQLFVVSFVILMSIVLYYYMLPGALEKAVSRVGERIAGLEDIENYEDKGSIPISDFVSKLIIRLVSHYTPIAFILSLLGLFVAFRKVLKDLLQKRFYIDTLSNEFMLLMFFLIGAPSALLLYSGSFIHPYFTFQWIPFFILGSLVGLNFLTGLLPKWRKVLVAGMIGLFLVFSVPRSYVKVSGKSLIDLLFNGKVPTWYKQTS
jgi:hypothetical protein